MSRERGALHAAPRSIECPRRERTDPHAARIAACSSGRFDTALAQLVSGCQPSATLACLALICTRVHFSTFDPKVRHFSARYPRCTVPSCSRGCRGRRGAIEHQLVIPTAVRLTTNQFMTHGHTALRVTTNCFAPCLPISVPVHVR